MTRLSELNQYYLLGDGTATRTPPFIIVGTVIMQSDVAVNDVPGSAITLTNLGSVTKTVDGFSSGIPSFVFTRAAAAGIGIDDHADLDIGTNDFTVEGYLKTTTGTIGSVTPSFWANDRIAANGLGNPRILIYSPDADLYNGSWRINGATGNINNGSWHHIALTRLAGAHKLWVDGVQTGVTYTNANSLSTNGMGIFDWSTNGSIDGELAMWRFTNGTALYTGSFTPPTNLLDY